jgi:hypothetical protein
MCTKYGIQDGDFYNFDETGFIIGMICPFMVVTQLDRCGKGKAVQPSNREWATVITCISGHGFNVPPFLLVQGQYHLINWYTIDWPRSGLVPKFQDRTGLYQKDCTVRR